MTLPPVHDPSRPAAPQQFDFMIGSTPAEGSSEQSQTYSTRPRGADRRRARVDSRSIAVPIVITLSIVGLVAGAAFAGWSLVQKSEEDVKADSAAFCANLAETPGVLSQPGFGWPTDGADLAETLDKMTAYSERWATVASVAPPTIKPDAAAVAKAASVIVEGIETSKSIDRPATLAAMQRVTSATDLPAWSSKYCD